ncbi:uncharacterized protein CMU_038110 [Cryptosporidium muris RN66]|uniref:Uncharacterized protein n=1 Tax=Cryptosporidium muris (strain RN66) TaxID=441375 RepID=B6A954_CRYMR|nr:uncharacterized protein CMU_038110 [Cryptosporidium muris RN66]EEA04745.1 hypothetical protein, conserved [Cryptosporidium muris RN66]|eukprot:XP_002139094.1 hypothetical protein [Cryptosporidium muris RN66]
MLIHNLVVIALNILLLPSDIYAVASRKVAPSSKRYTIRKKLDSELPSISPFPISNNFNSRYVYFVPEIFDIPVSKATQVTSNPLPNIAVSNIEIAEKIDNNEVWSWNSQNQNWFWGPPIKSDGNPVIPVYPKIEAPRAYTGPLRIYGPIQIDDFPRPRVIDIMCKPYESLIGIRAWFPNPDSKGRKDLRGIQFLCSTPLDARRSKSKSSQWSKIMGNAGPHLKQYTVLTRAEDPFVKLRIFIETLNPVKHPFDKELIVSTSGGPKLVYVDDETSAMEKGAIYLIRRITLRTKNNHLSYLGGGSSQLPSVVEIAPKDHELIGFRVILSGYPLGQLRHELKGEFYNTWRYRNSVSIGLLFGRSEDILTVPKSLYGHHGVDFQYIKCEGKVTGLHGYFMGNRGLVGLKVECDRVWGDVVLGITEGTDSKVLVGQFINAVTVHLSPEMFIQSLIFHSVTGRQKTMGSDWTVPTIRSSKSEGGGRHILQGVFVELDESGAISMVGFHWKKPIKPGVTGEREDFGFLDTSQSETSDTEQSKYLENKEEEIVPKTDFFGRVPVNCPIKESKCPTGVPMTGIRLVLRVGETKPKPFKDYLVALLIQCGDEFQEMIGNPNNIDLGKRHTFDILIHEEDPIVRFRAYLGDKGLPHIFDIVNLHELKSRYELYGFRIAMMIGYDRISAIMPLYRPKTPIELAPVTAKDISLHLFGAVRPVGDPDIVVLETSCPLKIPITSVRMWFVTKKNDPNISRLIGLRIRCGSKWRRTKLGSGMGDRHEKEVPPGDFISKAFVNQLENKPFYTSAIVLTTFQNNRLSFGGVKKDIMKNLAAGDIETEIYGFIGQETAEGLVSIAFLERPIPSEEYPPYKDVEIYPYPAALAEVSKVVIDKEDQEVYNSGNMKSMELFRPGEEWFGKRGLMGSYGSESVCAPGTRLTSLLVHQSSTSNPPNIIGLTLFCDGNPLPPLGSTLGDIIRYEIPQNEPIEKVEPIFNQVDGSIHRLKLLRRIDLKKRMSKFYDRVLSGFDAEIRKGVIIALSPVYTNNGESGPSPKIRLSQGKGAIGPGSAPLTDRKTPWGHANSDGDVATTDEYSCEEGTKLTKISMVYNQEDSSNVLVGLKITCNGVDYDEVGLWINDNNTLTEEVFELKEKEFIISIGGIRTSETQSIGQLFFETNFLRQYGEWQHYYVEAPGRGMELYGFELLFEKSGDYTTAIAMLLPLFRKITEDDNSNTLNSISMGIKNTSPFHLSSIQKDEDEIQQSLLSSPTITTDWVGLEVPNLEVDGIWCKTSRLKLDGRMLWDDWKHSRMTGIKIYSDGNSIKGIALQCGGIWLEEAFLGLVNENIHNEEINNMVESDADFVESVEIGVDARSIPMAIRFTSSNGIKNKLVVNNNALLSWIDTKPNGDFFATGLHIEYDPDTNIIFRIKTVYRPIVTVKDTPEDEDVGFVI